MSFLLLRILLENWKLSFSAIFTSDIRKITEDERVILAAGRLDLKEEETVKMLCEEIIFLPREPRQLFITISGDKSFSELLTLKTVLASSQGGHQFIFTLSKKKSLC